jgi:hypothetical protein
MQSEDDVERETGLFDDFFSDSGGGTHDWSDAWGTACLNQIPSESDFGDLATHDYVDTCYWRGDD